MNLVIKGFLWIDDNGRWRNVFFYGPVAYRSRFPTVNEWEWAMRVDLAKWMKSRGMLLAILLFVNSHLCFCVQGPMNIKFKIKELSTVALIVNLKKFNETKSFNALTFQLRIRGYWYNFTNSGKILPPEVQRIIFFVEKYWNWFVKK